MMRMQRNGPPGGPRGPRGGPPHMAGMVPGDKAKNFNASMKRLLGYLRPVRLSLIVVLIVSSISVVFSVLSPTIFGEATDILLEGYKKTLTAAAAGLPLSGFVDYGALSHILLILGFLYAISALFQFIQGWIMSSIARRIVYDLRRQIDEKLDRLPLSYFDKTPRGEILARITGDVDNISGTLQQNIMQIVTSAFSLVGVVIMMFSKNVLLTLVSLLTVPIVMLFSRFVMKRSHRYFKAQWAANGELTAQVEESFTGHMILKAFNRQEEAVEAFSKTNRELGKTSFKAQFISGVIMPFMMFMNNLNFVVICFYGALKVIAGQMSVGDVQAMSQYSRQFTQPIQQIASIVNVLQSTVASAERVFELLDEAEQSPEPLDSATLQAVTGAVCFEDVHFSYQPEMPLIAGMNLYVLPGSRVAVVGPTGAGKTTLVNLIMRFYELDSGRITIDGIDIAGMRRDALRGFCGMVLQESWLFEGSIRQNIAYGRENATESDVFAASADAHADHFIRTLEEGYDTKLTDEATNISQGQRQLLTIARAFLSEPSILILDEATSSVDTRTEVLIQQAMDKLMQGRTCFIIAHRLSTIRNADVILVMRNGAIVEQGKHEELLALGGVYHELYHSQYGQELQE